MRAPPCGRKRQPRAGGPHPRLSRCGRRGAVGLVPTTGALAPSCTRVLRVVLDTDPGVDDALALLLALRCPELQLVGVTTVAGNVGVEQGSRNARAILAAAGANDVFVCQGADRPLAGRLTTASYFHGEDGLGGLALPDAPELTSGGPAAEFLVGAAIAAEPLTVIAIGPLTNLAHACRLDPRWPARVERIVVMGGAIGAGNVTPVAEANVHADPEAAAIVLGSGAPITLVTLDVTMQAPLPPSRWQAVRAAHAGLTATHAERAATALLDFYMTRTMDSGGPALHDPLAVAVACDPSLVTTGHLKVAVECQGEHTRGQSVVWAAGERERTVDRGDHDDVAGLEPVEGTIDVAFEVDADRFLDFFLSRLFGRVDTPE